MCRWKIENTIESLIFLLIIKLSERQDLLMTYWLLRLPLLCGLLLSSCSIILSTSGLLLVASRPDFICPKVVLSFKKNRNWIWLRRGETPDITHRKSTILLKICSLYLGIIPIVCSFDILLVMLIVTNTQIWEN